jgi:hypothetical protein
MPQDFVPLATASGSTGSIYSSGFTTGNDANIAQNNLNNATNGGNRRRRKSSRRRRSSRRRKSSRNLRGGNSTTLQPIPVAYSDGGGINNNYATLTELNNQSTANSVGDAAVTKGGRRSHKRRTNKRRQSRKRMSRRHK